MPRLEGKVVFITGAGRGIGRAAAILFATEGARVAVAEINSEAGLETVRLIEERGGTAFSVETDVTLPESVEPAIQATIARYGKLDILYNNVGGTGPDDASVTQAPLDEFWRAIRVNLFGTWLCSRAAIPHLIDAGGGSIINTVSIAAVIGMPDRSAYAAAKGGVASLTRALAVDYGKFRIRANAIAPSVTLTERIRTRFETNSKVRAFIEQLLSRHLLGAAEPLDVAQTALYLASDDARLITGQVLRVDSGMTIT